MRMKFTVQQAREMAALMEVPAFQRIVGEFADGAVMNAAERLAAYSGDSLREVGFWQGCLKNAKELRAHFHSLRERCEGIVKAAEEEERKQRAEEEKKEG